VTAVYLVLCGLCVVSAFVSAYRGLGTKTQEGGLFCAALLALSFMGFTIFLFLAAEASQS
jgi:hypothetical protein